MSTGCSTSRVFPGDVATFRARRRREVSSLGNFENSRKAGEVELKRSEAGRVENRAPSRTPLTAQAQKPASTCQVYKTGGGDTKRVIAKAVIAAPIQVVWRVLTDYERLTNVVPNLQYCERLASPVPGRFRLRQRAGLTNAYWKLQAEALLEVQESNLRMGAREVSFQMVEGDFKEYFGRWLLEPNYDGYSSVLKFDAVVLPKDTIPELLFDHAVRVWLPLNVKGIADRAEQIAQRTAAAPAFAAGALEVDVPLQGSSRTESGNLAESSQRPSIDEQFQRQKSMGRSWGGQPGFRPRPSSYLGTTSVPLPPKLDPRGESTKGIDLYDQDAPYPAFNLPDGPVVSEVHLRKLDTDDTVHRRVVAMITIGASVEEVWGVLTDYDRLSEFLPNIGVSESLPVPKNAPAGYRRIRQVAVTSEAYIQLHTDFVLDIVEKIYSEIQFRQVRGIIDTMQGKWILSKVQTPEGSRPETVLKYAVEIKVPAGSVPLRLMEPTLERVVVQDIPVNLTAIKQQVERVRARQEASTSGRPPLAVLSDQFDLLQNEIERNYGANGKYFPTRNELRQDNRSDLEKAISAQGGPAKVAERMGWRLKYKKRRPRGYWDNMENIRQEIEDFIDDSKLPMGVMPKKVVFRKAGRDDIRRAIERSGGLNEVANALDLALSSVNDSIDEAEAADDRLTTLAKSNGRLTPNRGSYENGVALGRNGVRRKMRMDVRDLDALDVGQRGVLRRR